MIAAAGRAVAQRMQNVDLATVRVAARVEPVSPPCAQPPPGATALTLLTTNVSAPMKARAVGFAVPRVKSAAEENAVLQPNVAEASAKNPVQILVGVTVVTTKGSAVIPTPSVVLQAKSV